MFFKHYFRPFCGLATLLALTLVVACAKERTPEEKKREDERRRNERLKRAEGTFAGYARLENDGTVPAALDIALLQNPKDGNDTPTLEIKLNVGFFDGVTLNSSTTSFDWKTGELNAAFKASSEGGPTSAGLTLGAESFLELNAHLSDDGIESAVLSGSYTGNTRLMVERVKQFQMAGDVQIYGFHLKTIDDSKSRAAKEFSFLNLKTLPDRRTKPLRSDLPSLPAMEAGFSFTAIPHTASTRNVYYDPLEGSLRIRNQEHSEFLFRNLYASADDVSDEGLLSHDLSGELHIGGQKVKDIVASYGAKPPLPPPHRMSRVYVGTYTPASQQRVFKTVAYLDDLGRVGTNAGEAAFATFPAMRFRMLICDGNAPHSQRNVELFYLDYLNYTAKFASPAGAADAYLYEFSYAADWASMSGSVLRSASGAGGSPGAPGHVTLTQTALPYNRGCADLSEDAR